MNEMKELLEQYVMEKHQILRTQEMLLRIISEMLRSMDDPTRDNWTEGINLMRLVDVSPADVVVEEDTLYVTA